MGKSSPKQPTPPDPGATAAAQAAANKEAAIAQANINMVNQYTPYGTLEYAQRGTSPDGTPQYSATQTLSPEQQTMLDLSNQAGIKYGQTANTQLDTLAGTLSAPLSFESLGAVPRANEQTRQATADALYGRLNPQFDRDFAALETRLANQGIGYGSEAYGAAMDDFNRARNDARLAVEAQAGNEMARTFGLETASRNQAINEMAQQRQIPLNELAAMLSGSQVQAPSFVNTPQSQVAPADYMGTVYGSANMAQNAYNQQMASNTANRQGLYGLLGTGATAGALAWSDRRLKTDIERIGEFNGLPVYRYLYIWGVPGVGVMADEAKALYPHAVVNIGGFDAVNYEALR